MRRAFTLAISIALVTSCSAKEDPAETPPPSCVIAAPTLGSWQLTADGSRLRDALGRIVILRGVNAGGRSKLAPYTPFDFTGDDYRAALDAYLDRAASFGFDVLRVPFTWAALEPTEGTIDQAWLARYELLLEGAWKRGMRTIVDFHQDIYAERLCGDGFPDWTIPEPKPTAKKSCADWFTHYAFDPNVKSAFDRLWKNEGDVQTKMAAMWELMAKRFAGRGGVFAFEIINEPSIGTASKSTFSSATLTPFFATMAAKVHAAAPDALVLFEPPVEESVEVSTKLVPPPGKVMFAPHWYDVSVFLGTEPKLDKVHEPLAKWRTIADAWKVPLLLGESGVRHDSEWAPALIRALYDAVDDLGIGFTYWEYSTATEVWNDERFSITHADGSDIPGVSVEVARPYPRAIAGEDPKYRFDAVTRTFTLSYVPKDGVTEVVVPTRAFPNGARMKLTGACLDASRPGVLLLRKDPDATRVELRVTAR